MYDDIYVTGICIGYHNVGNENSSRLMLANLLSGSVESDPLPLFVSKFYWNTMLIHLYIICGNFHAITADLSMACEKLCPLEKNLPPDLDIIT